MIKALNDKVIVKPVVKEDLQKVDGIFLPVHAKEQLPTGTVVSIGPKVTLDIKVGDNVILPENKYLRIPVKCDDVMYELVAQENLIGVVEDTAEVNKE